MDQTTPTADHDGILASWAFWMDYFRNRRDEHHGLDIRKAKESDILQIGDGQICPFCRNAQVKPLPEVVRTANYDVTKVLCVCKLMKIANAKGRAEESSWQTGTVAQVKELDIPKGAAQFTSIIKRETIRFIRELGLWIYLSGGYGCGKTQLAYAVKSNMRSIATYTNVADLSDRIYEATGNNALSDLTDSLIGIPVLVIDDLGAEHSTDYLYSVLYKVINGRYTMGFNRPTYITSNLTVDELSKSPIDNLRRIASRLSDTKLVVQLVSKQADYRGMNK